MKSVTLPFQSIELSLLEDRIKASGSLMSYTDTCGFFLCQKGFVRLSINSQERTIQAGDVFLYLPATYICVLEISPDLMGITYKSSVNFVLPLVAESRYTKNILSLRNNPCVSLSDQQRHQVEMIVEGIEMRKQMLSREDEWCQSILLHAISKMGEALIHEILYYFFASKPQEEIKLDSKDHILQTFIINLMQHFRECREVSFYAQQQCLTPRYFSSIIKEKSGKTPQQWIIQMVINSCKQTLLYSPKSIKEIAQEFHFANQSFFGKYFKEYTGVSPKEFRAQKRNPQKDLN